MMFILLKDHPDQHEAIETSLENDIDDELSDIFKHTKEIGKLLAYSCYVDNELVVHINRISGLSEFYNTFISTCLHPDAEKITEHKTNTIKKKKNPIFNTTVTVCYLDT